MMMNLIQNFQNLNAVSQKQILKILVGQQNKQLSLPDEDIKHHIEPEKMLIAPSNVVKVVIMQKNIVTKYAFATRVGYMPGNPNKQNQDAFVLHPNFR